MTSLASSLNISIAEAREISRETDCVFTSNFADGQLDGENNFKPVLYQWFNSDYRRGYLIGIAKRISVKNALICGVEINKIALF